MSWFTSIGAAVRWLRQARSVAVELNQKHAEAGDAAAQYAWGERCHDGSGVARDRAMALRWFLRAAEQGHLKAQMAAGMMLYLGRGAPPDLVEAVKWLSLASMGGDAKAAALLDKLRERVPTEVMAEGLQRATFQQRTRTRP